MLPEDKDSIIRIITKFNPWVRQLWVIRKIMQNFKLEFSLQMPQLPVVYIRPDFKTELHSFFQNSVRRPVTLHCSSVLSCISVALLN